MLILSDSRAVWMGGDAVCIAPARLAIVPHTKYRRLCCAGEKRRKKSLFVAPYAYLITCDYVFIYTILPIETSHRVEQQSRVLSPHVPAEQAARQ